VWDERTTSSLVGGGARHQMVAKAGLRSSCSRTSGEKQLSCKITRRVNRRSILEKKLWTKKRDMTSCWVRNAEVNAAGFPPRMWKNGQFPINVTDSSGLPKILAVMSKSSASEKNVTVPPPLSLTTCWDKGKWHFEAASFPRNLKTSAGYAHILAVLRFLDGHGQLTASGSEELSAGEEIALLDEHIKPAARAFLDQTYETYLGEIKSYEQPLSTQFLVDAWTEYTTKYDISKKPSANAYQKLLLYYAYDHSINALLRAFERTPGLPSLVRDAIKDAPASDRPLIEATVTVYYSDADSIAESWPDPASLLHALRYLDRRKAAATRLRAAVTLAKRLNVSSLSVDHLVSLVWAVNLGVVPEAEAAWRALASADKKMLNAAVNSLFSLNTEPHLALCAMRTVGDAQSLRLIEQSVGDEREGTIEDLDGSKEPSWERIRREAREATLKRLGSE
jgi:hypothetical protein